MRQPAHAVGLPSAALFLYLMATSLFSQNLHFSASELKNLQKYYGDNALLRIADYHREMLQLAKLEKAQQLEQINLYANRFQGEFDAVIDHQEEHWKTPKEFLAVGSGDCEDYVSLKYFSLIDLNFDESKLFFAIVKDRYSGAHHMVLLYHPEGLKIPLVLDNLSFRILPLDARSDLELVDFFNSSGRYRFDAAYKKVPQKGNYREFRDLLQRVESGK